MIALIRYLKVSSNLRFQSSLDRETKSSSLVRLVLDIATSAEPLDKAEKCFRVLDLRDLMLTPA